MESIFQKKTGDSSFSFRAATMSGDQTFLFHWHEYVEILYSLSSDFSIGIENETYCVCEGETVIVGPGMKHCIFPSDAAGERFAILLDPALIFSRIDLDLNKNCFSDIKKHSAQWDAETQQKVRRCVLAMKDEFFEKKPGWRAAICSELFGLTVIAMREIPGEEPGDPYPTHGVALRRALEYLGDNFAEDISLETCAGALGYNKSYLSSMFKKNTGTSFHSYLTNIRLGKAEWLLKNEDCSIAEIAERSGFSSLKTFHRVFAQKFEMSPGSYRSVNG